MTENTDFCALAHSFESHDAALCKAEWILDRYAEPGASYIIHDCPTCGSFHIEWVHPK